VGSGSSGRREEKQKMGRKKRAEVRSAGGDFSTLLGYTGLWGTWKRQTGTVWQLVKKFFFPLKERAERGEKREDWTGDGGGRLKSGTGKKGGPWGAERDHGSVCVGQKEKRRKSRQIQKEKADGQVVMGGRREEGLEEKKGEG